MICLFTILFITYEENVEELYDYLDNLKIEEKLRFIIDKGNSLFQSSKTKTMKFLKNLVLDIIYFNGSINKEGEEFTEITEKTGNTKSTGISAYTNFTIDSSFKKRNDKSRDKSRTKHRPHKNSIVTTGNKFSYKKLLNIFTGFTSQLEDFIEFVIERDKDCEVEFLYR